MRRLLAVPFALVLVSLGLMTAAVAVGRAQPLPERLLRWHLDACALPCWNGITPGVTTLDTARTQIASLVSAVDQPVAASELIPGQGKLVSWAKANALTDNYWTLTLETNNGLVPKLNIQTNFPDDSAESLMPRLGEIMLLLGPPTCVRANARLNSFSLFYDTGLPGGSTLIMVDRLKWTAPVWFFVMDAESTATCATTHSAPWHGLYPPEQYRTN